MGSCLTRRDLQRGSERRERRPATRLARVRASAGGQRHIYTLLLHRHGVHDAISWCSHALQLRGQRRHSRERPLVVPSEHVIGCFVSPARAPQGACLEAVCEPIAAMGAGPSTNVSLRSYAANVSLRSYAISSVCPRAPLARIEAPARMAGSSVFSSQRSLTASSRRLGRCYCTAPCRSGRGGGGRTRHRPKAIAAEMPARGGPMWTFTVIRLDRTQPPPHVTPPPMFDGCVGPTPFMHSADLLETIATRPRRD